MKITDIVSELKLKVLSGAGGLSNEITGGYAGDLLSDVIGNAKEGELWVTMQTHQNIIAVASLKDLSAVIVVKDYIPDADTLAKSDSENIPLLGTDMDTFNTAGRLYELLKMK